MPAARQIPERDWRVSPIEAAALHARGATRWCRTVRRAPGGRVVPTMALRPTIDRGQPAGGADRLRGAVERTQCRQVTQAVDVYPRIMPGPG